MVFCEISTSSWHWKVYMFAVAMWSKFLNKKMFEYERPNLCAYIRMLTLYLPIVLTLNIAIYTSPVWVASIFAHLYGSWILFEILPIMGEVLLWVIYTIVCLICVGVFASFAGDAHCWLKDGGVKNLHKVLPPVDKKAFPSFTQIILQHLSDKHNMFCRKINVVSPQETSK